jgi:hypothetical protein
VRTLPIANPTSACVGDIIGGFDANRRRRYGRRSPYNHSSFSEPAKS